MAHCHEWGHNPIYILMFNMFLAWENGEKALDSFIPQSPQMFSCACHFLQLLDNHKRGINSTHPVLCYFSFSDSLVYVEIYTKPNQVLYSIHSPHSWRRTLFCYLGFSIKRQPRPPESLISMARGMGNKIVHVVLVKKLVNKLQRLANASRAVGYALSPRARRGYTYFTYDSDENGVGVLPRDVPKGHFAVYVGSERSRFVVPTTYLSHPIFQTLLEKAGEEYGFDHQMGLTLPCEEVAFEYITSILEREDPTAENSELNKIMDFFHHTNTSTTSVC